MVLPHILHVGVPSPNHNIMVRSATNSGRFVVVAFAEATPRIPVQRLDAVARIINEDTRHILPSTCDVYLGLLHP